MAFHFYLPPVLKRRGGIAQSVTCLTVESCLTADPGVTISIPAWPYTFAEIDHEIIPTAILLPSTDLRRVVTSQNMCTKYWLTA